MSYAPFDVQQVVDRLNATVPTSALRLVGVAADYAAVKTLRDFPTPCCYVLLARERFADHPPGHGRRGEQVAMTQRADVTLGLVVAARNYREQRGAPIGPALNELLGQIRASLGGWVPDAPGARPLNLVQGDLLQYDDATALWSDVWHTQTLIGPEAN